MIYLDYAAATPVSKKVLEAMAPYFSERFFNPSAPYLPALEVKKEYEAAKDEIAHTIGAKGVDLVMTSGATEATNLAFSVIGTQDCLLGRSSGCASCNFYNSPSEIKIGALTAQIPISGAVDKNYESLPREALKDNPEYSSPPKVLYLETEHDSVRKVAERYGGVAVRVKKSGIVDLGDLRAKITRETVLVSVSLVNNEIGVIQPLSEVFEIIREERLKRMKTGVKTSIYFHSDASQALNLLDVNVARLGVDLMTLNAAKIYGPKGVGALYVGHNVKLNPVNYGGGQERGLRSGTENVPGVVGFAVAAKEAKAHIMGNRKKYAKLAEILRSELEKAEVLPMFLGDKKRQLANFIPVAFPGVDAERLIYKLEEKGIFLSTGAACAASKGQKSHVLAALGLSSVVIQGSLRITLGAQNNEENVREAGKLIVQAIKEEVIRAKK